MPTPMNPTQQIHESGQSIWLDNIKRNLFTSGRLKRAIDELSLSGLTSNSTIFHNAISKSSDYDADIRRQRQAGQSVEDLFFDLALEGISAAADLFRPIQAATNGFDGGFARSLTKARLRPGKHRKRGHRTSGASGQAERIDQDRG